MSVLRPITDAEFDAWRAATIPAYANDKVKSGQWSAESALELSRKAVEELLPQGPATPDNYLFTILDLADNPVGTLWFAAQDRGGTRVAYVYDVVVAPAHRRQGHAARAFDALEMEVARLGLDGIALHLFGHNSSAHALYVKLGYVATNISMFKPVAPARA